MLSVCIPSFQEEPCILLVDSQDGVVGVECLFSSFGVTSVGVESDGKVCRVRVGKTTERSSVRLGCVTEEVSHLPGGFRASRGFQVAEKIHLSGVSSKGPSWTRPSNT